MNSDKKPFEKLPPLAGLCSFEEAMRHGVSVDESVQRLKYCHYNFKRLQELLTKRLISEPTYELKMAFSYHTYLFSEHMIAVADRIAEMREPPLGLEVVPHPNLKQFFDEILKVPSTRAFLVGVYEVALPALKKAIEQYLFEMNPLVDAPSGRLFKFANLELEEVLEYGRVAVAAFEGEPVPDDFGAWHAVMTQNLAAAGGSLGIDAPNELPIPVIYAHDVAQYERTPARDERFSDPFNLGVNAEAFIYDDGLPAQPKTLMLYFKRLREIDVPELMASIIADTPNKPFAYYRDMTRQLWDEARHALMGEVGFRSLGLEWATLTQPNYTFSYVLNTHLSPQERHAVLYFIEQGLMPKHGKRFEWELAKATGEDLLLTMQDFDWADEVLHAQIGRKWFVSEMPNRQEAVKYGDEAWARVTVEWAEWKRRGLTQHENWWPELYKTACERWGVEPDPAVLAFNTSYEGEGRHRRSQV